MYKLVVLSFGSWNACSAPKPTLLGEYSQFGSVPVGQGCTESKMRNIISERRNDLDTQSNIQMEAIGERRNMNCGASARLDAVP